MKTHVPQSTSGLTYDRQPPWHLVRKTTACGRKSGSFQSGAVRPLLLNVAVGVWGVRLASYLFARILKTGLSCRKKHTYVDACFIPHVLQGVCQRNAATAVICWSTVKDTTSSIF